MSAFQIHNTEDFITLESVNQAISIIGFSITKVEDGVLTELSKRILSFIDSFGYSSVIQINETSLKLYIIISAPTVGEVIDKSSILLSKMQKIDPVSPYLIISPINHTSIAENLRKNYSAPIKKTSEPRIVKLDGKYWIFASFMFAEQGHPSITRYFQDLQTFPQCSLNLSTRVFNGNKNGKKTFQKGILISYHTSSFGESIEYLKHLQTISLQYKERFSLTIRFHSLSEIKRNKILYLLGLSNKSQTTTPWNNFFRIEKFVPNIRERTKREVRKRVSSPREQILTEKRSKSKFLTILQLFRIPTFFRKISIVTKTSKSNLETTTVTKKEVVTEQESTISPPLIPYGKEISDEDIEELVKKIPPPPAT